MHTTIYSISESPKQKGLIWVGTDDGNIQLTRDGGKTWTNVAGNIPGLPKNSWNEASNSQRGDGQRWVLVIAGWDQGGYENELKRVGPDASVVFLGPRFGAEKTECYRTCDAFILPSLSEGLPMTVLEA